MNRDLTVAIQAGGRSSRMGQDKALVRFNGRPMIEHIIDRVSDMADDLIIITNNRPAFIQYGLRLVSDPEPGAGALPGLKTALKASTGSYTVLIACDMPFVSRPLLDHQVSLAYKQHADVVVPRWDDHLQTMHAVYRRESCLHAVEHALASNQKRMISFYDEVLVRILETEEVKSYTPNGRAFLNINTPEELAAAEALL